MISGRPTATDRLATLGPLPPAKVLFSLSLKGVMLAHIPDRKAKSMFGAAMILTLILITLAPPVAVRAKAKSHRRQ